MQNKQPETVREAVGYFHNLENLQDAINDLQLNGFAHHELSVLANEDIIIKKLGHLYKRVEEAEDDPKAPRTIFVLNENLGIAEGVVIGLPLYVASLTVGGIVIASGGSLLSILFATTIAGIVGATIGTFIANFIKSHHAEYVQKQVDNGGILLWVSLRSPGLDNKAKKILEKHSAKDVHIHQIAL